MQLDASCHAACLFRHGARAPTHGSKDSKPENFPNGLGELTEGGIEGNKKLGQFLQARYVRTKFLRLPLLPSQVYFRSKSNNRCLMSVASVGNEMFKGDKPQLVTVPIYSYEKGEDLLDHPRRCSLEMDRLEHMCKRVPDKSINWPMFEAFVFDCMGLMANTTLFKSASDFAEVEALYTEMKNGLTGPDWFESNKDEIIRLYEEVFAYNVGAGHPETLQLKQGKLLYTIINTLSQYEKQHKNGKKIEKRKFIAYSTQDWILQALLNGLGAEKKALGTTIPNFNSLIIFELVENKKKYSVKVLYKDGLKDTAMDISDAVRNCEATPCPIEKFIECCDDYKIADPKTICGAPR